MLFFHHWLFVRISTCTCVGLWNIVEFCSHSLPFTSFWVHMHPYDLCPKTFYIWVRAHMEAVAHSCTNPKKQGKKAVKDYNYEGPYRWFLCFPLRSACCLGCGIVASKLWIYRRPSTRSCRFDWHSRGSGWLTNNTQLLSVRWRPLSQGGQWWITTTSLRPHCNRESSPWFFQVLKFTQIRCNAHFGSLYKMCKEE